MRALPKRPRWKQAPRFAKAVRELAQTMTPADLRRALFECRAMTTGNVDYLCYALRDVIASECAMVLSRRDRRRKQPLLFPLT